MANRTQADNIRLIRRLDGMDVTVSEHSTLNFTKGTIHSKRFVDADNETLLNKLKKYDVTDLYKIKRKQDNTLVNTGTIILTFDKCVLPTHVKIGWKSLEVREYIPAPRRCYKCQRFNHSSRVCQVQQAICVNCGEAEHGPDCKYPAHCVNCDGAHPSSDKGCFYFKMEVEVLATKTKEKLSYGEAKKKVLKRFIKPQVTFADVVASGASDATNMYQTQSKNRSNPTISVRTTQAQQNPTANTAIRISNVDNKQNSINSEQPTLKPIPTVVTTYNTDKDEQLSKKRANTEIKDEESNVKVAKTRGLSYAAQNSQAGNPALAATLTFGPLQQPPSAGTVVSSAEGGLSQRVQQQSSAAGVASSVDGGSRGGCSIYLRRRGLLTLLKVATHDGGVTGKWKLMTSLRRHL